MKPPMAPKRKKMIRVLLILLTATLLIVGLLPLSGCVPKTIPFKAGTYISENDSGSSTISKIKVVLTEISEEQFNRADGWNVIREYRSDRYIRYYHVELSVFVDELGAYQQLNIIGFKQRKGAPQIYSGEFDHAQETFGLSSNFGFFYGKRIYSQNKYVEKIEILTYQNGSEYYYYAELQDGSYIHKEELP